MGKNEKSPWREKRNPLWPCFFVFGWFLFVFLVLFFLFGCLVGFCFFKLVETLTFGKQFNISLTIVTVLVSVNWSAVLDMVTFKKEIAVEIKGIFLFVYFNSYQHLQKAFCSISGVLINCFWGGEDKWYFSTVNCELWVTSLWASVVGYQHLMKRIMMK